jgi:hypothetical protein
MTPEQLVDNYVKATRCVVNLATILPSKYLDEMNTLLSAIGDAQLHAVDEDGVSLPIEVHTGRLCKRMAEEIAHIQLERGPEAFEE